MPHDAPVARTLTMPVMTNAHALVIGIADYRHINRLPRVAAPVVRLGLQPGQLPAAAGVAPARADLDADDAAGEADQDRGESRESCEGRHVPAGGGGGAPGAVRGDPRADRSAAGGAEPGMTF